MTHALGVQLFVVTLLTALTASHALMVAKYHCHIKMMAIVIARELVQTSRKTSHAPLALVRMNAVQFLLQKESWG